MTADTANIGSRPEPDEKASGTVHEAPAATPSPAKSAPAKPAADSAAKRRKAKRKRGKSGAHGFRGLPRLSWFIFALNTFAILVLVAGIVAADRSRVRLIDARKQELATQGQIFAEALAVSAVRDNAYGMKNIDGVETPIPLIDGKRADDIIRNLVLPTKTRARLYDYRGHMLIDSKLLESGGAIDTENLPPPGKPNPVEDWLHKAYNWLTSLIPHPHRLRYSEVPPDEAPKVFGELAKALQGQPSSADRYNDQGELIVSVGMPVKLLKVTVGALLLTTEGSDIDKIVRRDNEAIFRVVIVSFVVSLALSTVLARSIANPIRELAQAADEAASGPTGTRVSIPDFSRRHDEIGELSVSLSHMTKALYDRIEAIERFAADVSHEIKNPLTSIRSAVETLQLAKRPADQSRLVEIVRDDVRRLDRLITDISAASRLDAELARGEREKINLPELIGAFVETAQSTWAQETTKLELEQDLAGHAPDEIMVRGYETRLAQVLHNLIGNARSFSPEGGVIRIGLHVLDDHRPQARLTVEDEGPGIPPDNLERIFERFYTSRPGAEFGKNSGLGLSICRQIIEAQGGRIWAENRMGEGGDIEGARFVVLLPLLEEA